MLQDEALSRADRRHRRSTVNHSGKALERNESVGVGEMHADANNVSSQAIAGEAYGQADEGDDTQNGAGSGTVLGRLSMRASFLDEDSQRLTSSNWRALQMAVDEDVPVPIDVEAELCRWASDRAQVLSRTVRGVMLYADALRVQAALEGVADDEIETLVASKFEYVVAAQVYGKLSSPDATAEERWKAACIDELRHRFAANLKIAYVQGHDRYERKGGHGNGSHLDANAAWRKTGYDYFSMLAVVDPTTHEESVLYKVKLPGNPIVGEGKPENQNHAIIFTKGECMQTLDMNQDNYLGEAYKLRNLLECFTGTVRIVGCREHIFSEGGGAVAAFAASNEFAFGTAMQRFMAFPLCVRFHYGHPDVWDKQWATSNGGVSKASRTLHLSEDIFGGFNVVARGGSIVYQEFIHVGKGRDVTFIATNGFEQKISAGNAFQSISRDAKRLSSGFDLARLLSFFCSGQGEHPIVS